MDNYLFAQQRAEIQSAVPEVNACLQPTDVFSRFPFVREFGRIEFRDIRLRSLDLHYNEGLEVCYIHKGRYQWNIEDQSFILFPGDCFFTFPWQRHGSPNGFLDLGEISWIILAPEHIREDGKLRLGRWSGLSPSRQNEIGRILLGSGKQQLPFKGMAGLFDQLYGELKDPKLGLETVIPSIVDKIFIELARRVGDEACGEEPGSKTCLDPLEKKLVNDLSYPWTLEEMAEIMGLGQTSLNQLVRSITGFAPGRYLMHLRISDAKRRLKESDESITSIAFSCGFSSSQHFSSAFKRATGYRPRDYRRKTLSL